jgi:hypothetical protein
MMMEGSVKDADSFVRTFATSIRRHLLSMRIKDIEHTCLILQFLNYTSDMGIYKAIEEALLQCDKSDPRSGRHFVFVIAYLSRMGHFHLDSIEKLIHLANRHCDVATIRDNATLASAGMKLCSSVFPNQDVREQLQFREMNRTGPLYLSALGSVAELDCCVDIEIPEYAGERLAPELRQRILSIARSESTGGSSTLSTRLDILADVRDLLGDENVFFGKVFPHAPFASIVFCLRKVKPLVVSPLPGDFVGRLAAGREVARPPQNIGKWYAVLVPRRDNLNYYGQPIGIVVSQIRQVQRLGYVPLCVQHWAYSKAKTENHSKAFLRSMIESGKWLGKRTA